MPKDPILGVMNLHPIEVETIRRMQDMDFSVEQYVIRPNPNVVQDVPTVEDDSDD